MSKHLPSPPKWTRNQLIFGWLGFNLGLAMFVVIGLGWEPFGRPVDFGYLPIALVAMGAYIVVGINLVALLRGDVGDDLERRTKDQDHESD